MRYYVLASGSTGNCTAIENDEKEILLVDCGIPLKDIKQKMMLVNLDFNNIKKVLITHMHTDHCQSLRAFKKEQILAHKDTNLDLPEENLLSDFSVISILGFDICILPMSHDIEGTIGFMLAYNGTKLAYLTDTGYVHINIQELISNCDIYVIESNHDPRMLMMTKRPAFLKNRILSIRGHLSNQECSLTLANVIGPKTKEIMFIHRSLEANSEELIIQTFQMIMEDQNINYENLIINIARAHEVVKGGSSYEKQI